MKKEELEVIDLGIPENVWNKMYFKSLSKGYTLEEIEKQLKALEIIKEKQVDVELFFTVLNDENQTNKLHSYNFWRKIQEKLTGYEYDLLKEVLLK